MTEKRISLVELCGGAAEAKKHFLEAIGMEGIKEEYYRLLPVAWEAGFTACVNMIFDAVREGKISISADDGYGGEWIIRPEPKTR